MDEKPRDYKRRVDAEWRKNERNKNKLIKKIKEYELLDERYKEGIEKEILEAFSKKEKEEKGKDYNDIVKLLEDADKKCKDLNNEREILKEKEREKEKKIEEIKQCKLDGEDNTMLNKWRKHLEDLERDLNAINSEIEGMRKEIADKEEEIRVIEESYGKKEDVILEDIGEQEGDIVEVNETSKRNLDEMPIKKYSLKQFREKTIKDLWGKDRKRIEILKILEEGAGIGDKLSEKIEKEVTDKFFKYYDEKQGDLRMETASFLRNSLRKREQKYEKIKAMVEGEEKEKKLKDFKRAENSYGVESLVEIDENRKRREREEREEIERNLIKYREQRKRQINLNYGIKQRIINAADKISVKFEKDGDGCMLRTIQLPGKVYQILEVKNVYSNSDGDYINSKGELSEKGMIGVSEDIWKNEELGKYVKKKQSEGLHIPTLEEMRELLEALGKEADLQDGSDQIAILMYLTGMYGHYFITMGSQERREELYCEYDLKRGWCHYTRGDGREPLLLYGVDDYR